MRAEDTIESDMKREMAYLKNSKEAFMEYQSDIEKWGVEKGLSRGLRTR